MTGPLAGLRILDFTEGTAGPFATKQLADYGADVIKIERPGGDPTRRKGPFVGDQPGLERSGLFLYLNSNKRGIALNPADTEDRAKIAALAKTSDALVFSHHPKEVASWGIDVDAMRDANPKLVVAFVTPFGTEGPAALRKETDLTLVARSGWLLTVGEPTLEPLKFAGEQTAYLGGLHGAWGIIVGLFHASRTGQGQVVDSSTYESTLMSFDQQLLGASYIQGQMRSRTGKRQFRFPPVVMPVADGYVSLLVTDLQWPRFCRMAGEEEWAVNPIVANQQGRLEHYEELEVAFVPWFLSQTKQEVFDIAQANGVPIAPFYDVSELLADPHYQARDFFRTVIHPVIGAVQIPGPPARFEESPWELRMPAPLYGQHTAEVLSEIQGEAVAR